MLIAKYFLLSKLTGFLLFSVDKLILMDWTTEKLPESSTSQCKLSILKVNYSGDLNTSTVRGWNTEHVQNSNGRGSVLFSNGWLNGDHFVLFSNGPDHWKTEWNGRQLVFEPSENRTSKCWVFQCRVFQPHCNSMVKTCQMASKILTYYLQTLGILKGG